MLRVVDIRTTRLEDGHILETLRIKGDGYHNLLSILRPPDQLAGTTESQTLRHDPDQDIDRAHENAKLSLSTLHVDEADSFWEEP